MENFHGEVIIKCFSPNQVKEIAKNIHLQLAGNQDYIDSHIGIHMCEESQYVMVWFDDYEGPMPNIDFLKGASS